MLNHAVISGSHFYHPTFPSRRLLHFPPQPIFFFVQIKRRRLVSFFDTFEKKNGKSCKTVFEKKNFETKQIFLQHQEIIRDVFPILFEILDAFVGFCCQ